MQDNQKSVLRATALFFAKVLSIAIAVLLVAGLIIRAVGPSHTEIRNWHDLDAVRNNLGGNYILMNDLDSTIPGYEELASGAANQGKGWQPIGPFTGTFDGQGYGIRDLLINRPTEDYVGLFGKVGQGHESIIKDIAVVNATVTGRLFVGGLLGWNDYRGTVSNSYSSGNVTGDEGVGGLVGENYMGTVSNSYSTSSVTGNSAVGGLVGFDGDNGIVSNSYSSGNITGNDYVGGLVGENDQATVSNSYSSSSVTGEKYVGGLVGNAVYCTVSKSYSTGSVSGKEYLGGLVGGADEYPMLHPLLSICFWDVETSGQVDSAGTGAWGKTTAQMKDIATFSWGWNITAVAPNQTDRAYIWNIVDNVTYPFLSWQP